MLTELGVRTVIRDERHDGSPLEVKFHGELRQEQKAAATAILRHETGVLAATTAFGKTVVAAWLIAQRGVNALVLVSRRQLLDQWVDRLSTFLMHDPRLDTLFLTLPVSWRGTVAQYAGRLHRLCDGKREGRIYDYADLNVPMLARMFDRRCRGYEAIGYTILVPASAVPGWPADVVLPSDLVWKRDYSGSVRRQIETASTRRWRACSCTPRGQKMVSLGVPARFRP